MSKVWLLKTCTNLVSISLSENRQAFADLKGEHNDAALKTIAWLKECKKPRILAFNDFAIAIDLMVPILSEYSIHLTSLKYEGASLLDTEKCFPALANQTS